MCPLPTCEIDGCTLVAPAMSAITCVATPTDGEITELLFSADPFVAGDFDTASALNLRVDNDAVADEAVVRLPVTGKFNAPEVTFQRVEGGQQAQRSKKAFSIECDFFNDTVANYNAARTLMYCGKPIYIWFVMGGKIYGGEEDVELGIQAFLNITASSEGVDSSLKYTARVQWEASTMPDRVAFPLA